MWMFSQRGALPRRELVVLSASVIGTIGLFVACVDTTPPWRKVRPQGTGGVGGELLDGAAGGGGGVGDGAGGGVGPSWDGAGGAASDVRIDAPGTGAGGAIDTGLGGAGGGIDAGLGGAGGVVADAPLPGTGGVGTGGRTGSPDAPLGTGGTPPIDGAPSTGGTLGRGGAGTGGRTGSGGAGGAAALDGSPPVPDGGTLAGLTAYYPCESIAGRNLPDLSGKSPPNDGALFDSTVFDGGATVPGFGITTGKVGTGALALTTASQGYVAMPEGMLTGATEMTIATWVYVNNTQAGQRIFDVGSVANSTVNTSATNVYMNMVPSISGSGSSGRKLTFVITTAGVGGEQKLAAANFQSGVWAHVTIVLDGATGTLYVDGSEVATGPISLSPASLGPVGYAYIGKSWFTSDPYFDGMIDDFRVYRRALSAGDVRALYEGQ